jgi:hypothetical protein
VHRWPPQRTAGNRGLARLLGPDSHSLVKSSLSETTRGQMLTNRCRPRGDIEISVAGRDLASPVDVP